MVSDKDTKTLATVATTIAVVSRLAARVQDPNSTGCNAAMDHKVASVIMKRLGKHMVKKDAV